MFRELKNGIKPQIRLIVSNQGDHHSLEYTIKLQLKVSDPPHMVRCRIGRKDQKHAEYRFRSSFVFSDFHLRYHCFWRCISKMHLGQRKGNDVVFGRPMENAKDGIQLCNSATKTILHLQATCIRYYDAIFWSGKLNTLTFALIWDSI